MLHSLKPAPGSRKPRKRAGRGNSAGRGTTAGRGTKGQGSRSGRKGKLFTFEGGQTPLLQRQPKLGGFKNPNRVDYEVINIGTLEEKLSAGKYDIESLKQQKLIRTGKRVKLLSRGDVKKKFDLTVHAASKKAVEAIEKAGGNVTLLNC